MNIIRNAFSEIQLKYKISRAVSEATNHSKLHVKPGDADDVIAFAADHPQFVLQAIYDRLMHDGFVSSTTLLTIELLEQVVNNSSYTFHCVLSDYAHLRNRLVELSCIGGDNATCRAVKGAARRVVLEFSRMFSDDERLVLLSRLAERVELQSGRKLLRSILLEKKRVLIRSPRESDIVYIDPIVRADGSGPRLPPSPIWTCQPCGFVNKAKHLRCIVCGSVKPRPQQQRQQQQQQQQQQAAASASAAPSPPVGVASSDTPSNTSSKDDTKSTNVPLARVVSSHSDPNAALGKEVIDVTEGNFVIISSRENSPSPKPSSENVDSTLTVPQSNSAINNEKEEGNGEEKDTVSTSHNVSTAASASTTETEPAPSYSSSNVKEGDEQEKDRPTSTLECSKEEGKEKDQTTPVDSKTAQKQQPTPAPVSVSDSEVTSVEEGKSVTNQQEDGGEGEEHLHETASENEGEGEEELLSPTTAEREAVEAEFDAEAEVIAERARSQEGSLQNSHYVDKDGVRHLIEAEDAAAIKALLHHNAEVEEKKNSSLASLRRSRNNSCASIGSNNSSASFAPPPATAAAATESGESSDSAECEEEVTVNLISGIRSEESVNSKNVEQICRFGDAAAASSSPSDCPTELADSAINECENGTVTSACDKEVAEEEKKETAVTDGHSIAVNNDNDVDNVDDNNSKSEETKASEPEESAATVAKDAEGDETL